MDWEIEDTYYFDGTPAANGYAIMMNVRGGLILANNPTTGEVTITGTAEVGQTLTVDTSALVDADGLPDVYSYQWIRVAGDDETDIPAAMGNTYTPEAIDEGKTLKVRVSFSDNAGHLEMLVSMATAVVRNVCPSSAILCATLTVGAKASSGARGYCAGSVDGACDFSSEAYGSLSKTGFSVGSVDHAVKSIRWGTGMSTGGKIHLTLDRDFPSTELQRLSLVVGSTRFSLFGAEEGHPFGLVENNYRWDSTQAIRDLNVGETINIEIRRSNTTGLPAIMGIAQLGQTLTVDTTDIMNPDGLTNASYEYQWIREGDGQIEISGATQQTYAPVIADVGKLLVVAVTITDASDNVETRISDKVGPVLGVPTLNFGQVISSTVEYAATEGAMDGARVSVGLVPASPVEVVIPLVTEPQGGATPPGQAGADWSGVPPNLTFSPAQTEAIIRVVATDDMDADDGESVKISFGTLPAGTMAGQTTVAIVLLVDNDQEITDLGIPGTKVSNLGLPASPNSAESDSPIILNQDNFSAQGFTTGPNPFGFLVQSIVVDIVEIVGAATPKVSIYSDSGGIPGTELYTITGEETSSTGIYTFTAPANVTLSANTNYFLSFTRTDSPSLSSSVALATTIYDNEAAQPGWTLLDDYHYLSNMGWLRHTLLAMKVGIVARSSVNTAPMFETQGVATRSVEENTAAGTDLGAGFLATDADDDAITYVLEGADAQDFMLLVRRSGTVHIQTKSALDHETQASYSLILKAVDGFDPTVAGTLTVEVSVSDVDEPPGAPAAPAVMATGSQIDLLNVSWSEPANTGPAITEYGVRYCKGTVAECVADGDFMAHGHSGTTLTATIAGLEAGAEYQVQVRATNDEGAGPWSASGSGRPGVPDLTISIEAAERVVEGDTVDVTVSLSGVPGRTVSVPLTASPSGATSADYAWAENVSFDATETVQVVTFSAQADRITDVGESVELGFGGSLPLGIAEGTPSSAVIAIVDDDFDYVVIYTEEDRTYEVGEAAGMLMVSVRARTPARLLEADLGLLGETLAVSLSTVDGGALAGSDYVALANVALSFAPSDFADRTGSGECGCAEATKTVTLEITEDAVSEGVAENFGLRLSHGSGQRVSYDPAVGGDEATVEILDNDEEPMLSFMASPSAVGEDDGTPVVLTAMIMNGTEYAENQELTLVFTGTAVQSDDYTVSGTSLTLAKETMGASATATVMVEPDTLDEDPEEETIIATLWRGAAMVGTEVGTVTVTITDDDDPEVEVSFEEMAYSVAEGDSVEVVVMLSEDPERTVEIPIQVMNQGGATGDDYMVDPLTLMFMSGQTSATVTVTAADDTKDDDGESVALRFRTPLPPGVTAVEPLVATVTIEDNDAKETFIQRLNFDGNPIEHLDVGGRFRVRIHFLPSATGFEEDDIVITNGEVVTFIMEDVDLVTVNRWYVNVDVDEGAESVTVQVPADVVDGGNQSAQMTYPTVPPLTIALTTEAIEPIFSNFFKVLVEFSEEVTPIIGGSGIEHSLDWFFDPEEDVEISGGVHNKRLTVKISDMAWELSVSPMSNPGTLRLWIPAFSVATGMDTDIWNNTEAAIELRVGPYRVNFGAASYRAVEGEMVVEVPVVLEPAVATGSTTITIPLNVIPTGGASVDDYSGIPEEIHFTAGMSEQTLTVRAVEDDEVGEGDEGVTISFGTLPTRPPVVARGTIETEIALVDNAFELQTAPSEITISESAGAGQVEGGVTTVTVTATAPTGVSSAARFAWTGLVLDEVPDGDTTAGADHPAFPVNLEDLNNDGRISEVAAFTTDSACNCLKATYEIQLPIVFDDLLVEGTETLHLSPSTASGAVAYWAADSSLTIHLADDDSALWTADVSEEEIAETDFPSTPEDDSVSVLTLAIEHGVTFEEDQTLTLMMGGTAAFPGDFTISPADADAVEDGYQITILGEAASTTATVSAVDDLEEENDETVVIEAEYGPDAVATGPVGMAQTVTLKDTDSKPNITIDDMTVNEGSSALFTVNLSQFHEASITVGYSTSDGVAAVAGTDYIAVSNAMLTIAAGATSGTVSIMTIDDFDVDPDETFMVMLTGPSSNALLGTKSTATGTIVDSDTAKEVSFGAASYEAVEGGAAATVMVTISADPERTIVIPLTFMNQDEASASDYSEVPSGVTFMAGGALTQSFTVTAGDDEIDDDGESVLLGFGSVLPAGVTEGVPSMTTVTIMDDDAEPTLSFMASPSAVDEGDRTPVVLTASISDSQYAEDQVLTLEFSGTAVRGASDDYTVSGVSLTLARETAEASAAVTVTVEDDAMDEDPEEETIIATLKQGTTVVGTVTVTIEDDDIPEVMVSFVQMAYSVAEGDSEEVVVILTEDPERTVEIPMQVMDQGNASMGDYTVDPRTLTFMSGQTSTTVMVMATNDFIDDDGESVRLDFGVISLEGVSAGSTTTTTVSIGDDDVRGLTLSGGQQLLLTEADVPVMETYTVKLGSQPTANVTVTLIRTGADDLTTLPMVSPTILTFMPGDWRIEQTVTVTVAADEDAGDERMTVTHDVSGGDYGPSENQMLTVEVTDDEERGLALPSEFELSEGGEAEEYGISLLSQPSASVTIEISNPDVGAVTVSPLFLTFTADNWNVAQAVMMTGVSDPDAEDEEVVLVHTASGGDYADVTSEMTVTVVDDDIASTTVTLSVMPATVEEEEGATTVTVTAVLDDASRATATELTVSVADGTATAGADYATVTSFTLTIEAGQRDGSASFTFMPLSDDLDEPNETARVSATTTTGLTVVPATVTIEDDDAEPMLSFMAGATRVQEDVGTVTLTASISGSQYAEDQVLTLEFSGTAVPGTSEDYTVSGTSLTLARETAEASAAVTLTVENDEMDEDPEEETIIATLKLGTTVVGTVTVTIEDDDIPEVMVSFVQMAYSIAEGDSEEVVVMLSEDPERTVEIPVTAAGQDGATTADYSGVPNSVIFIAGGALMQSVAVMAEDDEIDDDGESVLLGFGSVLLPAGVTEGVPSTTTVTIMDDDAEPMLSFMASPSAVGEDDRTPVVLTASISGSQYAEDQILTLEFSGTAVPGASNDYTVSGTILTLARETAEASAAVTVTVENDEMDEDPEEETIIATLKRGTTVVGTVTVTIEDDDIPEVMVSFVQMAYSIAEGDSEEVVVMLSEDPERTVEIPVTAAGQDGATTADYSGVPNSVIFIAGGALMQSVAVMAEDDEIDDDGESVLLGFGSVLLPAGVTEGVPSTTTVTIMDDDAEPMLSFMAGATRVQEDVGTVTLTASISGSQYAEDQILTLEFSGTAVPGASEDYTVSGVSLTLARETAEASAAVTLTVENDEMDEDPEEETIIATLKLGTTVVGTVTVTIEDDDIPEVMVSFVQMAYSIAEGDSEEVVVMLSEDPERTVEIPVTAAGQDGATTADYSGVPNSVIFIAGGALMQSVAVMAEDDEIDDDGESVLLGFGSVLLPAGVTEGVPSTTTVTIMDDDAEPMLSFMASPSAVGEDDRTPVVLTASISGSQYAEDQILTLEFSGTAVRGTSEDYTVSGVSLTLARETAEASAAVTVTVEDDAMDEDPEVETIIATLKLGTTVVGTVTVTIEDDDIPEVMVSFVQMAYTVAEGDSVEVVVMLTEDPERTVEIPMQVMDQGNATMGDDYTVAPRTLTFMPGQTSTTVTVTATDDFIDDDGESVRLDFGVISLDGVSAGSRPTATVTIMDDDAAPILSFTASTPNVGVDVDVDEDVGTVTLTASISGSQYAEEQVARLSFSGTATQGMLADYTVSATSLTLAGETMGASATMTVTVEDDMADEDPEEETIVVMLQLGSITQRVTITIMDNDAPAVTVRFMSSSYPVTEGNDTTVTVELSEDPEREVVIPIMATDQGGAMSGQDYSGVPERLTFDSGDTSKSFTVTTEDDFIDDDGKSVLLDFGGGLPAGVTEGVPSTTTVTIMDDDAEPMLSFMAGATRVQEDVGTVTLTASISGSQYAEDQVLTLEFSGTAVPGTSEDYTVSGTSLTLARETAEASAAVTLTVENDEMDEDPEEETIIATLKLGTTVVGTVTVTIEDDDIPEVMVSFVQMAYSIAEGDSEEVVVMLSEDPERTVEIPVTAAGQDGATTADYSGVPNSVIFIAGGALMQSVAVMAEDDEIDDDGESVLLGFGSVLLPARVTEGVPSTTTVTIMDDDAEPMLSFMASPSAVGEDDRTPVVLTASISGSQYAEDQILTLEFSGTAVPGASNDYTVSGTILTLARETAEASAAVTVTVENDEMDEDPEEETIIATLKRGTTVVGTVTVTIEDDDIPEVMVSFVQMAYSIAEGDSEEVVVMLTEDPERTVEIPMQVMDQGNATMGDDYTVVPRTLTFMPGQTSTTVTVTAADDFIDDDGESVLLGFGSVLPARVTEGVPSTATVTIMDDDAAPILSFTASTPNVGVDVDVDEDVGTVTLTASISGSQYAEEQVARLSFSGTATQGMLADYTVSATSLTLAGETMGASATMTVTVEDDMADEDPEEETIVVMLQLGSITQRVTITIMDNDAPAVTVRFMSSSYPVTEGNDTTVTVELSEDPEREVVIPIMATDQGGAMSGQDYSGVPERLTFDSGDTSKSFTVTTEDDFIDDDGKSVLLDFGGGLPAGVTEGVPSTATVTIENDDTRGVEVLPSSMMVREGGSEHYDVTLSSEPTGAVTVAVSSDNGDVMPSPSSLEFTTINWAVAQAVTVSVGMDADAESEMATLTHTASGADLRVRWRRCR